MRAVGGDAAGDARLIGLDGHRAARGDGDRAPRLVVFGMGGGVHATSARPTTAGRRYGSERAHCFCLGGCVGAGPTLGGLRGGFAAKSVGFGGGSKSGMRGRPARASVELRGAGPVAQWLELAAHNRLVPGSNPGGPTKLFNALARFPNDFSETGNAWGRKGAASSHVSRLNGACSVLDRSWREYCALGHALGLRSFERRVRGPRRQDSGCGCS